MNRITVILGAGFSYNAGLPLANGINSFFNRDNRNNLLKFPSGEWKWVDFANDIDKNNGTLGFDHIAYGYILNELVDIYLKKGLPFNYEDFYHLVFSQMENPDFLDSICKKASKKFKKDRPRSRSNEIYDFYLNAFIFPQKKDILNLMNYLITDLLYPDKSLLDYAPNYNSFFDLLNKFEKFDIVTLNHDLVLEDLLKSKKISFSDGFSILNSQLKAKNNKVIRSFAKSFNTNNVLIKLHGSIDLYKYECFKQESNILKLTEEYIYYKTDNYYEKQQPIKFDLITGEVVQDVHFNITPQFITGKNKEGLIHSDEMYNFFYDEFKNRIRRSDLLLIIGYSFGDDHINKQIKEAISLKKIKKVINVNPREKFLYREIEEIEIVDKKYLEEI